MLGGHAPGALQIRPPALVCDYLKGGSLHTAISHDRPWLREPHAKVGVLRDTARGLDFLHYRRIVHFDLKSANILLDVNKGVRVADFGLSKQKNMTYVSGERKNRCMGGHF
jgi:serine/threonine protein kinase